MPRCALLALSVPRAVLEHVQREEEENSKVGRLSEVDGLPFAWISGLALSRCLYIFALCCEEPFVLDHNPSQFGTAAIGEGRVPSEVAYLVVIGGQCHGLAERGEIETVHPR